MKKSINRINRINRRAARKRFTSRGYTMTFDRERLNRWLGHHWGLTLPAAPKRGEVVFRLQGAKAMEIKYKGWGKFTLLILKEGV